MKEKWELFKVSLSDTKTMSKKEFLLIMAVCLLGGLIIGMFTSPRKNVSIGSHNGSNNQDNNNNNTGSLSAELGDGDEE